MISIDLPVKRKRKTIQNGLTKSFPQLNSLSTTTTLVSLASFLPLGSSARAKLLSSNRLRLPLSIRLPSSLSPQKTRLSSRHTRLRPRLAPAVDSEDPLSSLSCLHHHLPRTHPLICFNHTLPITILSLEGVATPTARFLPRQPIPRHHTCHPSLEPLVLLAQSKRLLQLASISSSKNTHTETSFVFVFLFFWIRRQTRQSN